MKKVLSYLSISSSDSYNTLQDLQRPNAILCPICLCETENNKILSCKHALCKTCFKTLKATKPYKCPCCRKEFKTPKLDPIVVNALSHSFTIGGISF